MNRTTLALAALVAALLGILLGLLIRPPSPDRPAVSASPSVTRPTPTAPTRTGGATPAEPTAEADDPAPAEATPCASGAPGKAGWAAVAAGFGRNFTHTDGGAGAWRQRLAPHVVPAVRDQLATVDLANVPRGHYASTEAVDCDPYQVAAQVFYAEGWSLILYLIIDDDGRWRVYRYDRFEE